jgi:hypothetical protein
VQGLFSINPEGDSKMRVPEVVTSVLFKSEKELIWMNVCTAAWSAVFAFHEGCYIKG